MKRMPSIKAVMTPFPYSVEIEEPIGAAEDLMTEHGFRRVPVTDGGKLVGVVTDRDISLLLGTESLSERRRALRVRDACALEAYVVELTEPLDKVLTHMAEGRIASALVVKQGKLVGIFTATDACRRFAEFLRAEFERPSPDEAA